MGAIHYRFLGQMDQFRVINHAGGQKLYQWIDELQNWIPVGWLIHET